MENGQEVRSAVRSSKTVPRGKRKGTVRYGRGGRINSDPLLYLAFFMIYTSVVGYQPNLKVTNPKLNNRVVYLG
jgi:hypothetical protein